MSLKDFCSFGKYGKNVPTNSPHGSHFQANSEYSRVLILQSGCIRREGGTGTLPGLNIYEFFKVLFISMTGTQEAAQSITKRGFVSNPRKIILQRRFNRHEAFHEPRLLMPKYTVLC